jgi:RNA polymerase sigma factor (sigma-70 family)
VQQVLKGNKTAFRWLVERYKNYVFAVIYPILRNQADTEDASQETFLKLYCSLSQYSQGSFRSWLGRIAVNTAIDLKRKQERIGENPLEGLDERYLPREPSAEEELLELQDANFDNLCRDLPEKYRSVVYQYYVQEKSCREIAAAQGVAVRTVESRLYRSRKLIKERLVREKLVGENLAEEGRQNGTL